MLIVLLVNAPAIVSGTRCDVESTLRRLLLLPPPTATTATIATIRYGYIYIYIYIFFFFFFFFFGGGVVQGVVQWGCARVVQVCARLCKELCKLS